MIPLVLTPSEVLAYHAGTLTEIRRPFAEVNDSVPANYRALIGGKHEPATHVFPDGSGKGWIGWWTRDAMTAEETVRCYPGNQGVRCPLGAPGDVLYGQEAWGVGCRPDPFDGCRDGVEYQADEALLDDGDDLPLHGVELPDGEDLCEWEGKGWQPAETMPEWAARIRLVNRGVRVEQADVWTWVVAVEVQK